MENSTENRNSTTANTDQADSAALRAKARELQSAPAYWRDKDKATHETVRGLWRRVVDLEAPAVP